MSVGEVCNRRIAVAADHTSVLAAAKSMRAHDERMLVVIDESDGRRLAVGIVTEHELAGVVTRETDPSRLALKDIMRTDPGFVTEADDIFATACWMRRYRLREAIVHDDSGRLAGIVTIDQLIESLAGDLFGTTAPALDELPLSARVALH